MTHTPDDPWRPRTKTPNIPSENAKAILVAQEYDRLLFHIQADTFREVELSPYALDRTLYRLAFVANGKLVPALIQFEDEDNTQVRMYLASPKREDIEAMSKREPDLAIEEVTLRELLFHSLIERNGVGFGLVGDSCTILISQEHSRELVRCMSVGDSAKLICEDDFSIVQYGEHNLSSDQFDLIAETAKVIPCLLDYSITGALVNGVETNVVKCRVRNTFDHDEVKKQMGAFLSVMHRISPEIVLIDPISSSQRRLPPESGRGLEH